MIPDWSTYCRFRDDFADVIDDRYYSIDWLDLRVLNGEAKFFASANAAIVAEIRSYPAGAKDVHGLIAAGDLGEIINVLIPQAEAWGKAQGCIAAQIESREAWSRALRPHGYETHQVIVRKEL